MRGEIPSEQKTEVEKAVRFIREHYREKLRVADIAGVTQYRECWLRKLFREATGQGIIEYLVALRIEKARELLRETKLPVIEIAYEVGFHNLGYFGTAFRRLVGLPPAAYRKAEGRIGGKSSAGRPKSRLVFRDPFRERSADWEPTAGAWTVRDGALSAESEEVVQVALARLLPENFRVRFRLRVDRARPDDAYALYVRLSDAQLSSVSYAVALGEEGNSVGFLTVPHGARPWSTGARLRYGEEQELSIELDSTTLRVSLDGEEVLSYREVFPARYAERCRIAIWYWCGRIEIRDFTLEDLGVPTSVPTVRLGDTLFNEGMVAKARSFYADLLGRTEDPEEQWELRYKIGMAHLALGELEQAELWLRVPAEVEGSGFWTSRARLSLLTLLARRDDPDTTRRIAELREGQPELSDEIDQVLQDEGDHLNRGGYFERALRFYRACLDRPSTPGWRRRQIARQAENCAVGLRRFSEARELIGIELREEKMPGRRMMAHRELSIIHAQEGRLAEAERAQRTVEESCRSAWGRVMALFNLCALRRARGKFAEALEVLDRVETEYAGKESEVVKFAPLYRAEILCGMGKPEAAEHALEGVDRSTTVVGGAGIWLTLYAPPGLRGRFEEAAAILRDASRAELYEPLWGALAATIAAMVLEIGGPRDEARSAWREVETRFPPTRVNAFSDVARELAAGNGIDRLVEIPYGAGVRSDLFYWAGRLFEKRGRTSIARRLMRFVVKEDPTRRWPAELARRWLRESGDRHRSR